MTTELDLKLNLLKEMEDKLKNLTTEKETIRKEVLEILRSENLSQYKNEVATVSQIVRKTIKYNREKEDVLKELEDNKLVKYFTVVPEVVVPEHKEFSKLFEADIKEGHFMLDGIEVTSIETPMIRFV